MNKTSYSMGERMEPNASRISRTHRARQVFAAAACMVLSLLALFCNASDPDPCYVPSRKLILPTDLISVTGKHPSSGYRTLPLQSGFPLIMELPESAETTLNLQSEDILLSVDGCSAKNICIACIGQKSEAYHKAKIVLQSPERIKLASIERISFQRGGVIYDLVKPSFSELHENKELDPIQIKKSKYWRNLAGIWVEQTDSDWKKQFRLEFDRGFYLLWFYDPNSNGEIMISDVKVNCFNDGLCEVLTSDRNRFTVRQTEDQITIIEPFKLGAKRSLGAGERFERTPAKKENHCSFLWCD